MIGKKRLEDWENIPHALGVLEDLFETFNWEPDASVCARCGTSLNNLKPEWGPIKGRLWRPVRIGTSYYCSWKCAGADERERRAKKGLRLKI